MEIEIFPIGAGVVALVAFARFNRPPPRARSRERGVLPTVKTAIDSFRIDRDRPKRSLFCDPPPRSYTTLLKFVLCRMAYAALALGTYTLLVFVPEVREQFDDVFRWVAGDMPSPVDTISVREAGPLVLAFIVTTLLPVVRPFKDADECIRRALYVSASIPARQQQEAARLKQSTFHADAQTLSSVAQDLAADGFEPTDIHYDPKRPTTRSLWAKSALLVHHLKHWQADDRYANAFAMLFEQDGETRSIEQVMGNYRKLMPEARACFQALRDAPAAPETAERETVFRGNCKDLLTQMYHLLSRISLQSHYSDRERIHCMAGIGFRLTPDLGGPVPDPRDLGILAVVIGAIAMLPLTVLTGPFKALMITAILYSVVLVPVMLAHWFRGLARGSVVGPQAVAFPVVAGLAAASVGGSLAVVCKGLGNPIAGWEIYATQSYPWSALHALLSALIAWSMRIGSYPDPSTLRGYRRYREWGSLRDAAVFAVLTFALMSLFVLPRLAELRSDPDIVGDPVKTALPTAVAFVIGFLVPTWYRANLRRLRDGHDRSGRLEGRVHAPARVDRARAAPLPA